MHKSVGAIITNDKGEILMIDRVKKPYGWACPAGHVDDGETPEDAMVREVREETGLDVREYELAHHEFVEWNTCSRDVRGHDWYVFVVKSYTGEVDIEKEEAKNYQWISPEKLETLQLENVWQFWHANGMLSLED